MTMTDREQHELNVSRILIFGSGFVFILAALCNEFLVPFEAGSQIRNATIIQVRHAQIILVATGLALFLVSYCTKKISRLDIITRKNWVTNTLLATLPVLTLLVILELSLRPYAESGRLERELTTIFMRDTDLGWRLKPNAEDIWGGVRVRINGKGLIGPEIDYAKRPGVKRILYLGDSVTFGFRLDDYSLSYPYVVENLLKKDPGYEIETINSAVGGYSPWQEDIFFEKEGIKYNPDLVVVAFVLNDVTSKFGLFRFGGRGEGFQLSHTASGTLDRLSKKSSIVYFSKKIAARIRFGSDVQQGAQQKEALDVEDLVYFPGRPDVREAWDITLQDLGKIFEYAKERDIPVVLAVFPFHFQFYDTASRSTPQKIVSAFAVDNGVPTIDLLPILSKRLRQTGTSPQDYFFDTNHLSPEGNEVVAEILADFIRSQGLLNRPSL